MTTYVHQPFNFEETKNLGINLHDVKTCDKKTITEIIQNRIFWTKRWLEVQHGFWTMYNRIGGGVGIVQITDILEDRIKAIWLDVKKCRGEEIDVKRIISNEIGSLLTDLSWTKKNGIEKLGFENMVNVIQKIHTYGLNL